LSNEILSIKETYKRDFHPSKETYKRDFHASKETYILSGHIPTETCRIKRDLQKRPYTSKETQ